MAGQLHRHRSRYAGPLQTGNCRPPEVMHEPTTNACALAGRTYWPPPPPRLGTGGRESSRTPVARASAPAKGRRGRLRDVYRRELLRDDLRRTDAEGVSDLGRCRAPSLLLSCRAIGGSAVPGTL